MNDLFVGADGLPRCGWSGSAEDYVAYHDDEWGREAHGDVAFFEKLTYEAFQSGLSWLTILRKRHNFRRAFADFDVDAVAAFDEPDVDRLMGDVGIVRNRRKIEATIVNAQATRALIDAEGVGGLDRLVWSFAPDSAKRRAPRTLADLEAKTAESAALSKELKRRGFVFTGPTTAYATMQACGLVNDHLVGCHAR